MMKYSKNKIELSYVLPVFFNQTDTNSLLDLLNYYASFSPEVLDKLEFIIVDDHSPVQVKIPSSININYRLFRITDDIVWNQGGARNLGAVHSVQKMILTDCDHRFPEKLLKKIIASKTPQNTLYTFKRNDADGRVIIGHRNTFYTSKYVFFKALGVDEEFCGNYGCEDTMFRLFARRQGIKLRHLTRWIKIYTPEIDRENSYHDLPRNGEVNSRLKKKKEALLKTKDHYRAHSKKFLNFRYRLVEEKNFVPAKKYTQPLPWWDLGHSIFNHNNAKLGRSL